MISFIVPAFNEVDNIAPTVATIRSVAKDSGMDAYEIIIIDDGGWDGTDVQIADLEKQFQEVTGVRHPHNKGLGSAIRSGISIAKFPQFMVIPGDNDVPEGLVRLMLSYRTAADLVLMVPLNKELRNRFRNTISMLYQMIYMNTFDLFLSYINGPGIWPTHQAKAVGLRSERFSIISELNVKLLRSGCSFAEVPGYFQAGPKVRSTVTLRNLLEVVRSYSMLAYEILINARHEFAKRPHRIMIDFSGH